MTVRLLVFAQVADQLGFRECAVECEPGETARDLVRRMAPALDCGTLRFAVDGEYRGWDEPIGAARELALIPPVSGG